MAQLTKAAIMDAFVHLLEQMPMDQITVQAITAGCGISRNTFYYHYSDIFALLKAVLQRDMDMLLAQRRPGEHAREGLRRLIDYIADRQRVLVRTFAKKVEMHLLGIRLLRLKHIFTLFPGITCRLCHTRYFRKGHYDFSFDFHYCYCL